MQKHRLYTLPAPIRAQCLLVPILATRLSSQLAHLSATIPSMVPIPASTHDSSHTSTDGFTKDTFVNTSLAGLNDGFNAKESNVTVGRGIECSDKDSMEKGTTEKGVAEKVSADDAAKKGAVATKE